VVASLQSVHDFWQAQSCGEAYATGDKERDRLLKQSLARYQLEPYIKPFARFEEGHGKDVLEIGVGMGADHLEWAKNTPRRLIGIDLTQRAVDFTARRMSLEGHIPEVHVGDAERLEFADGSFDIVYAWGVLHHSPNTAQAINEVHRVLRPGGIARVMIYHRYSIVAYMLWIRYSLFKLRWLSLSKIYDQFNESPGTKAYTISETRQLFSAFCDVETKIQLSHGDLLMGEVGQRHQGILLNVAKAVWPRWLIKKCFNRFGTFIMVEAVK
jgi:ubiquinone/menaquinone biosynthesis C-methylase UbiE